MSKIEKVEIFKYAGFMEEPECSQEKNELWVQLKLLQDKLNEVITEVNKICQKK